MDNYTLKSTSRTSGEIVEDTVLEETATTRKIFRAMIVRKPDAIKHSVKGWIVHQRKGVKYGWEDLNELSLSSLKSGEGVKLELSSSQVANLCGGLDKLRAIAATHGVKLGVSNLVVGERGRIVEVVDTEHHAVIQELIARNHGDEFWKTLRASDPEIVKRLARAEIQRYREDGLAVFVEHLASKDWSESDWEDFFVRNEWIFGYGLDYCILGIVRRQANYGGGTFERTGEQKGEFITASAGINRFTTLVEIKRPDTDLFTGDDYRNGVPEFSHDLIHGISQAQVNTRTWDTEGSRREHDREKLGEQSLHTIDPEAILVIGHSAELTTFDRRNSFSLLRNNLNRPKIITFDELYERASHIVSKARPAISEISDV